MSTINVSPQFYKAIKNLKEAGDFALDQTTKFQDLIDAVPAAQEKLANLEAEYAERKRIADLNLSLAIKADKLNAANGIAKELNFELIFTRDLNTLQAAIAEADAKLEAAVKAESVRGSIATSSAVKDAKNTAALELAETKAQLTNANTQISFLNDQLAQLREDNKAMRETAAQMVESATRSQVNVTNTGK